MRQLYLFIYACSLLVGCNSYHKTSDPYILEKNVIWKTSYKILEKRYDIQEAIKKDGTIETEWDYKLSPMYLKSYRNRVWILVERCNDCVSLEEIEKEEERLYIEGLDLSKEKKDNDVKKEDEGKEKFVIRISVEKQQNRSLDNPNSKDEAFWFPDGFDYIEEQRVLNLIQAKLQILEYIEEDENNFNR